MPQPNDRPFPNEEPRADVRKFARGMREIYVAMQQEGFTEGEAMQIVGITIAVGVVNGGSGQ
jgi:hypothetical protein